VFLDGKYHELFEYFVALHELFGSARYVSVVVQDSHSGEASYMHLHGDEASQVCMNLHLLGWVDTGIQGGCRVVETE
jgi:hypothetical protein